MRDAARDHDGHVLARVLALDERAQVGVDLGLGVVSDGARVENDHLRSKDQQVTRTRTRQQNTRQQNKPLTRTQSEQRRNDEG